MRAVRFGRAASARDIGRNVAGPGHERTEQVTGLGRPAGLHQEPRDQLDGVGRRRDGPQYGAVADQQPVEEVLLAVPIAGKSGQSEDQDPERRPTADPAQELDLLGRLAKRHLFPAGGHLPLEAFQGPVRRFMLGIDPTCRLQGRPPQDQVIPLEQGRAQRGEILGFERTCVETADRTPTPRQTGRRGSRPRVVPSRSAPGPVASFPTRGDDPAPRVQTRLVPNQPEHTRDAGQNQECRPAPDQDPRSSQFERPHPLRRCSSMEAPACLRATVPTSSASRRALLF